jgi:hypothetical protein
MPEVVLSKGYSPWVSVLKGLKPLLLSAGVAALTTILAGLDVDTVTKLGVPTGIAVFLLPALQNWWKNKDK